MAPATFDWQYDSGAQGSRSLTSLVGEALVQNAPLIRQRKAVIAVDNCLTEDQQDILLNSLGAAGATDVELLWRPVALALAFMDTAGVDRLRHGNRLLVVDAESTSPEVTCLEIREHEGRLLPLRTSPEPRRDPHPTWGGQVVRRRIAQEITAGNSSLAESLLAGPFTEQFVAFTESRPCTDVWCRDGAQHRAVALSAQATRQQRDRVLRTVSVPAMRAGLSERFPLDSMAAVLWHGWPFRVHGDKAMSQGDVLLTADAVTRGADLYGARLATGEPAYLDTLPGLYILSEVKELSTQAFFPLVAPAHQVGGTVWRLDPPLTRFSIRRNLANFTAVVRRSDDPRCRKVVTAIPPPSKDTPVVVRAEMRPAHGRARVTIEGQPGYEDAFGEHRVVAVDWRTSEAFDLPFYYAPDAYPVAGRLFDEHDEEYRALFDRFIDSRQLTLYSTVVYRGHNLAFDRLVAPWGYNPPWWNAGYPAPGWQREPTRGMFGARPHQMDASRIAAFAAKICLQARRAGMVNDRPKFLNYMFSFAPDSFLNELRDIFSGDGRHIDSWNWVIAPGRVFRTRDDFSLFLEFILRKTTSTSFPAFPDGTYTQHYVWAFMRALCYYEDTAGVDPELVSEVLRRLLLYHPPAGKAAKYVLCAILFSLRLRRAHPDFMQPGQAACDAVASLVRDGLPQEAYPPAMFAEAMPDCLNDYVLRFVMQTATADDFRALEGLTTSMA